MELENTEISTVRMKVSCYKSAMQARGEIASTAIVQSLDIQLEENTTAGFWLIMMVTGLGEDNLCYAISILTTEANSMLVHDLTGLVLTMGPVETGRYSYNAF